MLPRPKTSPEPRNSSPRLASPRPQRRAAQRPVRRLRSPALGTWARLPGGQGAPAASRAGRQPRPGAPFLVGVSPPGLRVGGRASPGGRRAALELWARSSTGSILVPQLGPCLPSSGLWHPVAPFPLPLSFRSSVPPVVPPRASIFTFSGLMSLPSCFLSVTERLPDLLTSNQSIPPQLPRRGPPVELVQSSSGTTKDPKLSS